MDDPPAVRYARNPAARLKRVGGATALHLRERRAVHVLNATAELVWRRLETPASAGELAAHCCEATDGDPATIAADLEETLALWLARDLIQPRP